MNKANIFLSRRWVINAAKRWFGFDISFNTADDIIVQYRRWHTDEVFAEPEDRFEAFFMVWVEEKKESDIQRDD